MPPRRQQAAQAAPSLLSLPPEVLQHILASVPLADRLCQVALACKQLHALCTAPALLSELDVRISGEQTVTRTRGLLCFLMRHGRHVRSLQLEVVPEDGEDGFPPCHLCWLLRQLNRFSLYKLRCIFLPQVLAGLPALRYLTLAESTYTAASLAAVSGLTALTRLALLRVDNLPPAEALAALAPRLRVLEVHSVVGEEVLNSCVQVLTGLESLALDLGFNWAGELLLQPAMLALPRLRCLSLTAYDNRQGGGPGSGRRPSNLPEGPYLSALQSLAMPLPLALSALPVLAQAQHLHTLCLQLPTIELPLNPDHVLAFWRFVATHPPLRRLLYEVPASSVAFSFELHDALMLLKSQRPALEVRRLTAPDNRVLEPPACWAELSAS